MNFFNSTDEYDNITLEEELLDDMECIILIQGREELIIPRNKFIDFIKFLTEQAKVNNIG